MANPKNKPVLNTKLFGRDGTIRRFYIVRILMNQSAEVIHRAAQKAFPDSQTLQNFTPAEVYSTYLSKCRKNGLVA